MMQKGCTGKCQEKLKEAPELFEKLRSNPYDYETLRQIIYGNLKHSDKPFCGPFMEYFGKLSNYYFDEANSHLKHVIENCEKLIVKHDINEVCPNLPISIITMLFLAVKYIDSICILIGFLRKIDYIPSGNLIKLCTIHHVLRWNSRISSFIADKDFFGYSYAHDSEFYKFFPTRSKKVLFRYIPYVVFRHAVFITLNAISWGVGSIVTMAIVDELLWVQLPYDVMCRIFTDVEHLSREWDRKYPNNRNHNQAPISWFMNFEINDEYRNIWFQSLAKKYTECTGTVIAWD